MEDVYTIKIKTKPDTRNLYPSERRYSASTVSGLAWVHIALAATSLLLACLALVKPNTDIGSTNSTININGTFEAAPKSFYGDTQNSHIYRLNKNASNDTQNESNALNESYIDIYQNGTLNSTDSINKHDSNYVLVLAPGLITIFGLAAGVASFFASIRWYVDHNITWLFIMSTLSTIVSLSSFIMIIVWFIMTTEGDITDFYKDRDPFNNYLVVKHTDVILKNESHMMIALNTPIQNEGTTNLFTKHVLSLNILIAAFLELLWSILSMKISYKGMKNNYKEDVERRGNCVSVVTKIKGNDTRKLPRHKQRKPSLIENYPSKKIKRIFLAQSDNGFYMKNQQNKAKQNTETSSEFYKERMMNFLNRCASLEGMSNPDMRTPSVQSESVLNPIPEVTSVDINVHESADKSNSRATPVSWGDALDYTIYNQNTLNLDKIFNFTKAAAVKSDSAKSVGE